MDVQCSQHNCPTSNWPRWAAQGPMVPADSTTALRECSGSPTHQKGIRLQTLQAPPGSKTHHVTGYVFTICSHHSESHVAICVTW